MKLKPYSELRFLCSSCGTYQVKVPKRPRKLPPKCHHCGKPGVTLTAECTGKQPYYIGFSITKPKKEMHDWVKGGNRHSGKSTGRPRKDARTPTRQEHEVEQFADGDGELNPSL